MKAFISKYLKMKKLLELPMIFKLNQYTNQQNSLVIEHFNMIHMVENLKTVYITFYKHKKSIHVQFVKQNDSLVP